MEVPPAQEPPLLPRPPLEGDVRHKPLLGRQLPQGDGIEAGISRELALGPYSCQSQEPQVDIRGVGRAHRYPLQGQEPPPLAVAHQAEEAAVASHLPQLASPPPPEPLPLPKVGQPRAVHEQQRLLPGEEGLKPLPGPLEKAPKLLLPYPLGEAVEGLSSRGKDRSGKSFR
jgi:hypothetical protein